MTTGNSHCECDTTKVHRTITSDSFNRIPEYDTIAFSADSLYKISAEENKRLWYRDIENPYLTKFTTLWNAYRINNYSANQKDFVRFYKGKNNIDMAFQFGPSGMMWSYHIFVIKKINCCYLVTRSFFRHARFTYKAYAILSQKQMDSLYGILKHIHKISIDSTSKHSFTGYFADNRKNRTFYIDFENEVDKKTRKPLKEVSSLYDFVDNHIPWIATYDLKR